jgi:hypothetical protein
MLQMFGILGFFLGLLAIFFASEVMRRATHRQSELEMALFKANLRIQQIESQMARIDRMATDIRYERKRQAGTITALAQKGELKTGPAPATEHVDRERFTPSSHKRKQAS